MRVNQALNTCAGAVLPWKNLKGIELYNLTLAEFRVDNYNLHKCLLREQPQQRFRILTSSWGFVFEFVS